MTKQEEVENLRKEIMEKNKILVATEKELEAAVFVKILSLIKNTTWVLSPFDCCRMSVRDKHTLDRHPLVTKIQEVWKHGYCAALYLDGVELHFDDGDKIGSDEQGYELRFRSVQKLINFAEENEIKVDITMLTQKVTEFKQELDKHEKLVARFKPVASKID